MDKKKELFTNLCNDREDDGTIDFLTIDKHVDLIWKEAQKEQAQFILKNFIVNNWEPDCDNLIEYLQRINN